MSGCCKNCNPPVRHLGCHDTCEKYLEYKAENDRIRKIQQQENQNRYTISLLRKEGVEQARRKGRKIRLQ